MLFSREVYTFLRKTAINSKFTFKKHDKSLHTCVRYAAQVSFKLSDIGEGIREVVVKEWFVKEGDKVSQFDEICEVQSDKASVTITSRYDGVIKKLHYKTDDVALVGKPLIDIETEGDERTQSRLEEIPHTEPSSLQGSAAVDITRGNEPRVDILCIPSVRRLAKEHKIDLSQIRGTGKDGRILKEDVLKYIESTPQKIESVLRSYEHDRTEPIKGFQKAMVKTMTDSLKIPHFVYSDEVTVTKLSQLRQTIKQLSEGQDLKLSFMPFFIKAASNALQRFPILNATLDEKVENVTYNSEHNIGIAMDTKMGLAVPIIKNVDKLGIIEISNELNRLMTSGKSGTFSPEDVAGGTFTVSNIGVIGGTYMKPVIMPPQVAIIALGASRVVPRFDQSNSVVPVEVLNLSAAADHRIIDGATMARFIQFLKRQIEEPYLLFLNI